MVDDSEESDKENIVPIPKLELDEEEKVTRSASVPVEVKERVSETEVNDDSSVEQPQRGKRKMKRTGKRRIFTDSSDSSDTDMETDKETEKDYTDCASLLQVLLVDPQAMEEKRRPVGIRDNFICTLDRRVVPIRKCRSDDNGVFLKKGAPKRFYDVTFDDHGNIQCTIVQWNADRKQFYINVREGAKYVKEYLKSSENVYQLTKEYRESKHNAGFTHVIAYARKHDENDWVNDFYVSCYKWKGGKPDGTFLTPRHGNAKKPTSPEYHRTDPDVLSTAKKALAQGSSPSFVYKDLTNVDASSYSEQIRDPKQLWNLKLALKEPSEAKENEVDRIVSMMRKPDGLQFVRSVVLLPESFAIFAYTDNTLKNLEKFCVNENSVLRIDTTFEIVDGMWLTDTSYTNTSMINSTDSKHPDFPGPLMLHFRKDHSMFRRFALEICAGNPNLLGLRKVGQDMDSACKKGLQSVLKEAEILLCLEHVKRRDGLKLNEMGATFFQKKSILTDIYGCQVKEYLEAGLADCSDELEFEQKLDAYEDIWEGKVKGFHAWFKRKRSSLFKEQVVGSALDRLELCQRFTTNRLENFHKIQKAFCEEGMCKGDTEAVIRSLQGWIEHYEKESEKAFYGQGKFRLAPGYEGFKHPRYLYWCEDEKLLHRQRFQKFTPKPSETYERPAGAGLKRPAKEVLRKRGNFEVELFNDRLPSSSALPSSQQQLQVQNLNLEQQLPIQQQQQQQQQQVRQLQQQVQLLLQQQQLSQNQPQQLPQQLPQQQSQNDGQQQEDLSFLNPFRELKNHYYMVHWTDKKNCHKNVTRCEQCRIAFTAATDSVLIRVTGVRDLTSETTGKRIKKTGNVFLHNLVQCLKAYDSAFDYTNVILLKATSERLSANARAVIMSYNVQLEK